MSTANVAARPQTKRNAPAARNAEETRLRPAPGPVVAAQPVPVPLSGRTATQDAKRESEAALRGELLAAIKRFDERDLGNLLAVAKAISLDRGCETPAEMFLLDMIGMYGRTGGALNPKYVQGGLEEFTVIHTDAIEIARLMAQRFPKEVFASSSKTSGAAQEAQ